jgi:ribosomal protein S18 acetylase RimI-like enzyme
MSFSIRTATKEDATLVADLSRQTFYDTFAPENSKADMDKFMNQQFTRGKLMLEVGTSDNTFLLAYYEKEIAGYVKLRESRPPKSLQYDQALEIARLYAVTGLIGKGVGSYLMQVSLDVAREKGKEAVWLGVWEKNARAISFYTKWGFQKFDDTYFLLGDDMQRDWLMYKAV